MLLAEQIRVAYKTGRNDFFKLLLNQEKPEIVGRIMAYHDYYNRARSARISEITVTLNNLMQLETTINRESVHLESLKAEQLTELNTLIMQT